MVKRWKHTTPLKQMTSSRPFLAAHRPRRCAPRRIGANFYLALRRAGPGKVFLTGVESVNSAAWFFQGAVDYSIKVKRTRLKMVIADGEVHCGRACVQGRIEEHYRIERHLSRVPRQLKPASFSHCVAARRRDQWFLFNPIEWEQV